MPDVAGAVDFYIRILGFRLDYSDDQPLRYAVVARDEVYIHLSLPDLPEFPAVRGRTFIAVKGVESLWNVGLL